MHSPLKSVFNKYIKIGFVLFLSFFKRKQAKRLPVKTGTFPLFQTYYKANLSLSTITLSRRAWVAVKERFEGF